MFATNDSTDVCVIGGGPAGLATAIAARLKGFTVMVLDGAQPPIDKPCGEGMMPETLKALQQLGVGVVPGQGFPFRGIRFVQRDAHVRAEFSQSHGLGLRRSLLHETLVHRAAECGVKLQWSTPALGLSPDGVHTRCGVIKARWIVGADGIGSRVRRWSGLDSAVPRKQRSAARRHYRVRPWSDFMEVYWGRRAQAYVTPIGAEEVCVVLTGESSARVDFGTVLDELPELQRRLAGVTVSSRERGAVTLMHRLRRVHRGNIVLVGDASGAVDAITGEGLRLAFQQALALANAMEGNNLQSYEREHRRLEQRPFAMGRLLLWLGRNPFVRERVIRGLAIQPELFQQLLETHTGRLGSGDVVLVGAQVSWRLLQAGG